MSLDRRTVLKRVGTTAALGAGLATTTGSAATVASKKARLVDEYHDEHHLRSAFERHGEGVRERLVAEGYVSRDFDFESLDVNVESDVNGLEPTATDGRAGVTAIREDGTSTAFGTVSTSSDTHEIALFVQPERDETYALVEPKDSGDRVIVTASDAIPRGCSYQGCDVNDCCDEEKALNKTYDCDSDCSNCKVVDSSCDCWSCQCDTDGDMCLCGCDQYGDCADCT